MRVRDLPNRLLLGPGPSPQGGGGALGLHGHGLRDRQVLGPLEVEAMRSCAPPASARRSADPASGHCRDRRPGARPSGTTRRQVLEPQRRRAGRRCCRPSNTVCLRGWRTTRVRQRQRSSPPRRSTYPCRAAWAPTLDRCYRTRCPRHCCSPSTSARRRCGARTARHRTRARSSGRCRSSSGCRERSRHHCRGSPHRSIPSSTLARPRSRSCARCQASPRSS